MRRLVTMLAALAIAVGGIFVAAAPAQAGPAKENYILINHYGDKYPGWFWVDEQLGIIGCAKCSWWIDFTAAPRISQTAERTFYSNTMAGLGALSNAKVAPTQEARDRYRALAISSFTAAAHGLGSSSVTTGPVGYYDPDSGRTVADPEPSPWMPAADLDIVVGMHLLLRSFVNHDQDWVGMATAKFDEAYAEISSKQAIG